ncbi:hypothetical protein [Streptomyces sp. SID11385]|uniref:hypothetical protein n=1 Tax=Streptomyces sp. SID11385 TaxID=2706031 RepID=UPI0013CC77B3|nr:hypothetical protein [Streptomyces sp. SID11385]NEA44689.1 hypothetical protein [Streptomyces sp. SID11385]
MGTDWSRLPDSRLEYGRVPALLDRVERDDGDTAAWDELGHRLALEHDLVSPAGFAALPRLVRLAPYSARARGLAGETVMRGAAHHGCDDLFEGLAPVIAAFGDVLDSHLPTHPADWLACLRYLLAVSATSSAPPSAPGAAPASRSAPSTRTPTAPSRP